MCFNFSSTMISNRSIWDPGCSLQKGQDRQHITALCVCFRVVSQASQSFQLPQRSVGYPSSFLRYRLLLMTRSKSFPTPHRLLANKMKTLESELRMRKGKRRPGGVCSKAGKCPQCRDRHRFALQWLHALPCKIYRKQTERTNRWQPLLPNASDISGD